MISPHLSLCRLAQEDEFLSLRAEAGELRKEKDDYRFKLRKKEWECESRVMERDQYRTAVDKLKQKLNRKGAELNEAWSREQEVIDKNTQLQAKVVGIAICTVGYSSV